MHSFKSQKCDNADDHGPYVSTILCRRHNNQADAIEAFNSTGLNIAKWLNIDSSYFEQMVGQIYPTELQFNMTNSSDLCWSPLFEFGPVHNFWHSFSK